MSNILIIAEHENGKLKKYSAELALKAFELSKSANSSCMAAIFGENIDDAAKELAGIGISKIIKITNPQLNFYSSQGYSKVLSDVVTQNKPDIILGTASVFGKDLFARLALKLKAGYATDCTDIKIENNNLIITRPVYAGKALVNITINGTHKLVTLRPNTFPVPDTKTGKPNISEVSSDPGKIDTKIKETIEAEANMIDLTEAEKIVSAGRCIGSAENFKMIKELAITIGASIGASRAAVDAGFISHDHQVGQTGKTVNPKLYIACGISGAIQHLAGMKTSKVIVAINKDKEAPIFSKADYGIVGDIFTIVPKLTEKFKKMLEE